MDTSQESLLQELLGTPSSNLVRAYFLATAFTFLEILEECLSRPGLILLVKQLGCYLAAVASHERVLDLLLKHSEKGHQIPLNLLDYTRVYYAACDGDSYTITQFIQQGTKVDVHCVDGTTHH